MSNVRYFAHRFATKLFCAPFCNEVLVSTLGLDQTVRLSDRRLLIVEIMI